jgi:hypothetical protein
MPPFI